MQFDQKQFFFDSGNTYKTRNNPEKNQLIFGDICQKKPSLEFTEYFDDLLCYNFQFNKTMTNTAWKVSKHGVFSGPCFPEFAVNTKKYGPEKIPYLETFHVVKICTVCIK